MSRTTEHGKTAPRSDPEVVTTAQPRLSPAVAAEVQRILDGVARRLLAEVLRGDLDATRPLAGVDFYTVDRAAD